jgi:lysophospholipase L1-like esterase
VRRSLAVALALATLACARDNRWTITNAHPQGVAIVAFGDSLTSGDQMGHGESYPAQLSARIGRPILNRGDWGPRYRALARETGCVYLPDLLDGVFGDPRLMYDQIHPNAQGYARIAERIDSEVGAFLRR